LLACAASNEITTAWPVNGPLNPHLYTPNQMYAQSMVYEPLVKYQADGSVNPGWQKAGPTRRTAKSGPSPCAMT
jgi:nickel transport system substrate-binding protein